MHLSVSVETRRPRPSSIAMCEVVLGKVRKLAIGVRLCACVYVHACVCDTWITYSSVEMSAWQSSHIRTGISKPIGGKVDSWLEHVAHTALPQRRQWCYSFGLEYCSISHQLKLTCLTPTVLCAHISRMFQKKGTPHFSQALPAPHSAVCHNMTIKANYYFD